MTAQAIGERERMTTLECDARAGCITCADEGIPMRVLEVGDENALCVADDGTRHQVAIDLIETQPGRRVLVHAGVAIGAL